MTTYTITICTDCALAAAGYDQHEIGRPFEIDPLFLMEGMTVSVAHDEPYFSREACDGCGQGRAGDRHQATAIATEAPSC